MSMERSKTEAALYEILGEDHPVLKKMGEGEQVFMIEVIMALVGNLHERLKEIEERKIH